VSLLGERARVRRYKSARNQPGWREATEATEVTDALIHVAARGKRRDGVDLLGCQSTADGSREVRVRVAPCFIGAAADKANSDVANSRAKVASGTEARSESNGHQFAA